MPIDRYFETGFVVEKRNRTATAIGGFEEEWVADTAVGTVMGRLRPLSGDEQLSADRQTPYATHRFYTGIHAITTHHRITKGGRVYRVKVVRDVMTMGRHMEIDLEEVGHDQ